MATKETLYHTMVRNMVFGENSTDKEVTSLLFTIGWGYTFCFVLWGIVGKVFGVKAVAPYGKFVDTSYLTGMQNASLISMVFVTLIRKNSSHDQDVYKLNFFTVFTKSS